MVKGFDSDAKNLFGCIRHLYAFIEPADVIGSLSSEWILSRDPFKNTIVTQDCEMFVGRHQLGQFPGEFYLCFGIFPGWNLAI